MKAQISFGGFLVFGRLLPLFCLLVNAILLFGFSRIPIADTFAGTLIAHFFGSGVSLRHGLPLWAPYLAWGVDASVHYFSSVPPLYLLFSLLSRVIPGATELHVYFSSLIALTLVLFGGTWLLACRLYESRWSVALTSITVQFLASISPMSYIELAFIAPLPLTLYAIDRAVAEKKLLWLLSAAAFQVYYSLHGAALYFIIPQALFCLAYLASVLWEKRRAPLALLGRFSWREALPLLVLAAVLALPLLLLFGGAKHHIATVGRDADGTATFKSFVDGALFVRLNNLVSLALGTEISFRSWYAGFLAVPCLLVGGVFGVTRRLSGPALAGLFIFLFAAGGASFVGPLLYLVPGVDLFRNPGVTAALVRLSLVFVAGFGVDALVGEGREGRRCRLVAAGLLAGSTLLLWKLKGGASAPDRFLLVGATLRLIGVVALLSSVWNEKMRPTSRLLPILCGLTALELLSFRATSWQEYSVPASRELLRSYEPRKLPFLPERKTSLLDYPRFDVMYSTLYGDSLILMPLYRKCAHEKKFCTELLRGSGRVSDMYSNVNQFFEMDPCFTALLDPLQSPSVAPLRLSIEALLSYKKSFAAIPEAARSAIACGVPKLQLWTSISVDKIRSPMPTGFSTSAADWRAYGGDSPEPSAPPRPAVLRYSLLEFHPNHVSLSVEAPKEAKTYWLYYSDAWHPEWTATVDGKSVGILQANGGFKAIEIPGGASVVKFDFRPRLRLLILFSELLFSILCLGFLFFVFRQWREFALTSSKD